MIILHEMHRVDDLPTRCLHEAPVHVGCIVHLHQSKAVHIGLKSRPIRLRAPFVLVLWAASRPSDDVDGQSGVRVWVRAIVEGRVPQREGPAVGVLMGRECDVHSVLHGQGLKAVLSVDAVAHHRTFTMVTVVVVIAASVNIGNRSKGGGRGWGRWGAHGAVHTDGEHTAQFTRMGSTRRSTDGWGAHGAVQTDGEHTAQYTRMGSTRRSTDETTRWVIKWLNTGTSIVVVAVVVIMLIHSLGGADHGTMEAHGHPGRACARLSRCVGSLEILVEPRRLPGKHRLAVRSVVEVHF